MRTIVPKHMKMEIKDKATGKVARTVEKDYYSIGQVRELFREITEEYDLSIVVTPEKFLRGTLRHLSYTKAGGEKDERCNGLLTMDMYVENITTTDDWNKLLARMEKRLKTIACGLPDPEDEATEREEYERVTGAQENDTGLPTGRELSALQGALLERIFSSAGFNHNYIAPVFTKRYFLEENGKPPLQHSTQINSTMLDEFLGDVARAAGRTEKPSSYRDYTPTETAAIYKALREYIEDNDIRPIMEEATDEPK